MNLAEELLEQAGMLVRREPKHPKQASLRRAATAYYSLFHFLLDQATSQLATTTDLRLLIRRAFTHTEMEHACRSIESGGPLPKHITATLSISIPKELKDIAKAFVDLQQARHDADYNLKKLFGRVEVSGWIDQVRDATEKWAVLAARPSDKPAIELFLTGLLLWDRWGKGERKG